MLNLVVDGNSSSSRSGQARRSRVDQAEAIDYQVTPSFVALLEQLGSSLAITNYQSSTVMTFSSLGDGRPVRMFAPFQAAMGLALSGDRLAVAAQSEVIVLANIRKLAPSLARFPGFFDGYFVPRVRYTTGEYSLRYIGGCTEIHDIQVVPGVRHLGISGYDTDTHKLAIDLPDMGLWLDPPEDAPEQSPSAAGALARAAADSLAFRFCKGKFHAGS